MNAQARAEPNPPTWAERNQHWLVARIERLRTRIGHFQTHGEVICAVDDEDGDAPRHGVAGFDSALDRCARLFALSAFERDLLLLCAGTALDLGLARIVAELTGNVAGMPTFSLAMSALDGAHWDAQSPQSPLRFWRLVSADGASIERASLTIDERVLHFLTGVGAVDERLDGMVELIYASERGSARPDWVTQVSAAFAHGDACIHLSRPGAGISREQLTPLLAATGSNALWVSDLPDEAASLNQTLRLIDREAALSEALVVLDLREGGVRLDARAITRVQSQLRSRLIVIGDAPQVESPDHCVRRIALPEWAAATQIDELLSRAHRYGSSLDPSALRHALAEGCEQFSLSQPRALDEVARSVAEAGHQPDAAARCAWQSLREHSRGGLDQLAQRIDTDTALEDLVLPQAQLNVLHSICRQLLHRRRVYRDWGFAGRGARGLGLAALFAGESGTGKTMAAEAIASSAGLDLYRIDLASTVSKYIGETEKNLKKLFDAAELSGAVLLFDEADALFGKRSEVKDSHDRYANIETAYLLQRIETYRGLAILTTNMKSALDRAFLRRIRFVVQFPFPDERARGELWQRQFPKQAPLHPDIQWDALARLHLTGGHIRSVALNAAFMAAHDDSTISQQHLVAAAHAELAKLERSVTGGRA